MIASDKIEGSFFKASRMIETISARWAGVKLVLCARAGVIFMAKKNVIDAIKKRIRINLAMLSIHKYGIGRVLNKTEDIVWLVL